MPAEERKLATVLFADLVGSTELAEGEDPERVRAVLERFYDATAAEVERAGRTVEKFVGDAVMAAFGAPVAHEDDAEWALLWRWGCSGGWESCSAVGWRFASA
jgi:class 3 adenylate cyclase